MALWSSSSLGIISKYAFFSSLFLDKSTWSRQWAPSQIWVQCVMSLSIKQTGYRAASGGAWTVDWDELLLTFPHCCWGVTQSWVHQLKWDVEQAERIQRRVSQGLRTHDLQDEAERALASVSDGKEAKESYPVAACDYCQGPSEHVRAKCFHPDGKIKCHKQA